MVCSPSVLCRAWCIFSPPGLWDSLVAHTFNTGINICCISNSLWWVWLNYIVYILCFVILLNVKLKRFCKFYVLFDFLVKNTCFLNLQKTLCLFDFAYQGNPHRFREDLGMTVLIFAPRQIQNKCQKQIIQHYVKFVILQNLLTM